MQFHRSKISTIYEVARCRFAILSMKYMDKWEKDYKISVCDSLQYATGTPQECNNLKIFINSSIRQDSTYLLMYYLHIITGGNTP